MASTLDLKTISYIVQGFSDGTLSDAKWTHHAHLVVCTYFLTNYEYHDATLRIKLGIIKYNEASGLENTIDRGYHETMTLFWIWAVNAYLKDKTDWTLEAKVNGLLDNPFSKKYLPFFFYSEDHVFSKVARVKWQEPDVRVLDSEAILTEFPESIWYGEDL